MPKAKEDKVTKKETSVSTKKKIKSPKKEAVVVDKKIMKPVMKKKVSVSKTASAKGSSVSKKVVKKKVSVSKTAKFSPVIKMPAPVIKQEVIEDAPKAFDLTDNDDDIAAVAKGFGVASDDDDEVRLTPKIRISKISKLFHKEVEQKNTVGDSLENLQAKRVSYVDEDEEIIDDEIGDNIKDDDIETKTVLEPKPAPQIDLPSELPDLLPEDEQLDDEDELENMAILAGKSKEELALEEAIKRPAVIKIKEPKTIKLPHPKVYKRLAIAFGVLVLLLVVGVLYFTMVKVTISVALNEQSLNEQASVQVYDRPQDFAMPDKAVRGLVKLVAIEQSKLYQVSGNDIIGEEVIGQITLYNKYNKSQPLVASTRLLSASGKLYRLKNSVTVPAGGQVVADVYADEAKPESAVGAEQFTLPGLWEGLQDKIYGQSQVGAIKYQQKLRRIVTQDDIDKALVDLKQVLLDKVKADFDNAYDDYDYKLYQLDDTSLKFAVTGKVGEEKEQLPVTMKGVVEVVAFNSEQAQEIAKAESTAKLSAGQDLVQLDSQNLKYTLNKFDTSMVMAEVGLNYDIKTRANSKASIIDKNKIIGLSEDQLKQYLNSLKDIKVYNIEFFPSFIKQVPRLTDRIEIKTMD